MRIQVREPFDDAQDRGSPQPALEPNIGSGRDISIGEAIEEMLPTGFWVDDDVGINWRSSEETTGQTSDESLWEAEPKPLFVNMWVVDVEGRALIDPVHLMVGSVYQFLLAVEQLPRTESSEQFVEPGALTRALAEVPEVEVEVEVTCPFLEDGGRVGYIRRRVSYRAGYGFDPLTFILRPMHRGQYFLNVCILFNREPIYSEVLAINVSGKAAAGAPAEDIDLTSTTTIEQR